MLFIFFTVKCRLGADLLFGKWLKPIKFFRKAFRALKLIWNSVDKTTTNSLMGVNCSFVDRKNTGAKIKGKALSMLNFPITDEPGNPEKLQSLIAMLKSVGEAHFPMRYQVSGLGSTAVRNKFDPGDRGVGGLTEAVCKPKVPTDAARALHEL